MHRRMRCPGSHHAEHGLPETDTEWSKEGTELHRLYADKSASRDHLEPKQADLLQLAEETTTEIHAIIIRDLAIPENEPFETGFERALVLRRGIRPLIPGHCDEWRWYPRLKLLVIIDQKFGYLEVAPADANLQLRTYAVQGRQEWSAEQVVVAISQPRSYDQRYTLAMYQQADLIVSEQQLLAIWDACQSPDAPRIASQEACLYCKAKLVCETYRTRIAEVIPYRDQSPGHLSDQDIAWLWEAVKLASNERFVSSVRAEVIARIMEGRLPGLALQPAAPRRELTNTAQALIRIAGFDPTRAEAQSLILLEPALSLSFDGLTTVLRKQRKITEKVAKQEINTLLEDLITYNTPNPSIIPAPDKPKLNANAAIAKAEGDQE